MPAPTVPYKVMFRGYQVSGDKRSGYTAAVPYLVAWGDAFKFADDIFGVRTANTVGPISYQLPYRFPVATANLYAARFNIEPCGHDGQPVGAFGGLAPGENFTHAMVKVEYVQFLETQQQTDDPENLHQLDKDNPITKCKQAVKSVAKMETRKGGSYLFASTAKPLKGDVGVPIPEIGLELTFPDVPYLPWKFVKPYIGTVNSVAMMECVKGELLLEGMDTEVVPTKDGIAQQVVLRYSVGPLGDWNTFVDESGVSRLVYKNGTSDSDTNRIYTYKDHRLIFDTVKYDRLDTLLA